MAYLSSPDLDVVVRMPLLSTDEVRDRVAAAVRAGHAWQLAWEDGGYLLINPSVLGLIWITEKVPPSAAGRMVVWTAPLWTAPDEIPGLWAELEPAAERPS